MSAAEDFEEPADPAQFGTWLAQKTRAEQEAKLAAQSPEAMEAHRAVSPQLRTAHQGLFPHQTPYDRGAEVAERAPVVGSDYGGRPLSRDGGRYDHQNSGPAPGRYDLRFVDQPGHLPPGDQMSPALRHQLGLGEWQ